MANALCHNTSLKSLDLSRASHAIDAVRLPESGPLTHCGAAPFCGQTTSWGTMWLPFLHRRLQRTALCRLSTWPVRFGGLSGGAFSAADPLRGSMQSPDNEFTEEGLAKLLQAVKGNTTLSVLDVRCMLTSPFYIVAAVTNSVGCCRTTLYRQCKGVGRPRADRRSAQGPVHFRRLR